MTEKRRPRALLGTAERLGVVSRTLSGGGLDRRNLDAQLRHHIDASLGVIESLGVIAGFRAEDVTLTHFAPSFRGDPEATARLLARVREGLTEFGSALGDALTAFVRDRGLVAAVVSIVDPSNLRPSTVSQSDYAALVFRDDSGDEAEEVRMDFWARSALALMVQLLRQRVSLFAAFPGRISERYWHDAVAPDARNRLCPPWETATSLPTATLSFDLRRSTFCMENADDRVGFARWMDELVQILIAVSHQFGGVFDKFTGDGALVHFLDRECRAIYHHSAVESAVKCAVAMQRATAVHLVALRRMLRIDCALLGGAIGIDVAPAHWSVDHRHNPLTVGQGVVLACRIGDTAPAGGVRLSNIAFFSLPGYADMIASHEFQQVPLVSKEFDASRRIMIWDLHMTTDGLVKTDQDIVELCRRIHGSHGYGS